MNRYPIENFRHWFGLDEVRHRKLDAGEFLFRHGQRVTEIHFLEEGEIIAKRPLASGQDLTLFVVGKSEVVAEDLLYSDTLTYSAIATKPSQLLSVPKSLFLERLHGSKRLRDSLFRCLTQRYLDCLMRRELSGIRQADQRILSWLEWMWDRSPGPLDLNGRMGEIGDELSLTRESVYRALAKLEKKGLIQRDQGTISLTRPEETKSY